jgi:Tfp pilus assembly protein FimT
MNNYNFAINPLSYIIENKSNANAFTLLELMVIMAIFSILTGIGLFSVSYYIPGYQQKAAGRTVISDLVKAKIYAIKQRTPQTFTIINNRKYSIHNANDITDIFLTRDFEDDFGWRSVTIQSDTSPTLNLDGTINNISTINVNGANSDPLSITMTITGNLKIAD